MRKLGTERGFTLMELLLVITIIGILAGVGVVAMTGAHRTGSERACATDLAALRSAQEAYLATTAPNEVYGNEAALLERGLVPQLSTLHDVTVGATTSAATSATNAEASSQTGAAYVIKVDSSSCGTVGQVVS